MHKMAPKWPLSGYVTTFVILYFLKYFLQPLTTDIQILDRT